MMTVNKMRKHQGFYEVYFTFDNWEGEPINKAWASESKKEAFQMLLKNAKSYSTQCLDKIRLLSMYGLTEIPHWMNDLGEISPELITKDLIKRIAKYDFKGKTQAHTIFANYQKTAMNSALKVIVTIKENLKK